MITIPADKKITIAPDLAHLPATIRLPRDQRLPFRLLLLSGIWFIIAPFIMVFTPWDFSGWALFGALSILFVITLGALLTGIAALRRYASKDEITLSRDHVDLRRYGWVMVQDTQIPRSEFSGIWRDQRDITRDTESFTYHLIGLAHPDRDKSVPVFIHPERARADHFARRLERYLAISQSAS